MDLGLAVHELVVDSEVANEDLNLEQAIFGELGFIFCFESYVLGAHCS